MQVSASTSTVESTQAGAPTFTFRNLKEWEYAHLLVYGTIPSERPSHFRPSNLDVWPHARLSTASLWGFPRVRVNADGHIVDANGVRLYE